MLELPVVALLTGVSFFAGFLDSIAGGGGLLMVPAIMLSGLPAHWVLGTNKLASSLGTSVASWNFFRKGKINLSLVAYGIVFTLLGGWLGAKGALFLDPQLLAKVIIGMLPFGVLGILIRKKKSVTPVLFSIQNSLCKIPLICFSLGLYDGFFGPGAGSFLAISFYVFLHFNLVEATANAKVFNLVSNIGALIGFVMAKKVFYFLAFPLALANMLGNFSGSHLVLKKGDKIVKVLLVLVLCVLMATLICKYLLA